MMGRANKSNRFYGLETTVRGYLYGGDYLQIIIANLPPPDHVANLLEDELVQPKPAPIILYHAPAQPEGYVDDDDMEEDEEEDPDEDLKEERIEQVVPKPNNMDGFALHMNPQPEGNMNGWLIKDDDEELEEDGVVDDDDEEEMEMNENDGNNGGNNDEDDAEVINAYKEVDPLNRPPPTSDKETEFAPHVSSSTGTLLAGNGWVHAPGPMGCNLESIHRGVTRLDKQMFDRYKTEKRMAKKFMEDEFRMNRHEYDISTLDTAVKGRIPVELRFQEEPPIHPASAPRSNDPYAMVRDAAIAVREDDDDDTTVPKDSQPSEPRGSPRDPQ
ncbi:hypothetical protein Tco_1250646 [Tanacetum coccineum]